MTTDPAVMLAPRPSAWSSAAYPRTGRPGRGRHADVVAPLGARHCASDQHVARRGAGHGAVRAGRHPRPGTARGRGAAARLTGRCRRRCEQGRRRPRSPSWPGAGPSHPRRDPEVSDDVPPTHATASARRTAGEEEQREVHEGERARVEPGLRERGGCRRPRRGAVAVLALAPSTSSVSGCPCTSGSRRDGAAGAGAVEQPSRRAHQPALVLGTAAALTTQAPRGQVRREVMAAERALGQRAAPSDALALGVVHGALVGLDQAGHRERLEPLHDLADALGGGARTPGRPATPWCGRRS